MKIPTPRKLSSGTYFIQLRLNGKSTCITDTTKEKCIAKAMSIKSGLIELKKPSNITVLTAMIDYIDRRKSRLSPTTASVYEGFTRNHFQSIHDIKLSNLTWKDVDNAVNHECSRLSFKGEKLSPKTIKNAYNFLQSVLIENDISFDKKIRLPDVPRKVIEILPPELIIPVIKGTEIELPCLLSMWLTLSVSEIRGLKKSKSIVNGNLIVKEVIVDVKGVPTVKKVGKEEQRTRALAIPPYIMELIKSVDDDVIVPLTSQSLNRRFQRMLKNSNIPPMNFHKLRHISASVMADLDIPSAIAIERGGWKTDTVMKNVYTHTFQKSRINADIKISNYFENILK